jgi:hypothetical protein
MRRNIVIIGIVISAIAVFMILLGLGGTKQIQYNLWDNTYQQQYNTYATVSGFGIIFLIIGISIALIGLVLKSKEQNTKVEVTSGSAPIFDRETFLGSIMAIGTGIVILILIIWIEPLINGIVDYQWIILVIRIVGAIFILIGIVGIIGTFLPKKEKIQIEQEQK